MNDRFKFRGYWYNDCLKEWRVYDNPQFITGDGTAQIWYDTEAGAYPELPSDAELHLCQCTGLKDKNGKLIYEGDIVNQIYEDGTINKCEVVYNNCSFQFKHIEDKNKNYINTPMYCYAINYLGHYTEKRLEVIGNIYQDSHLLGN
jgi:uncharacterized phage protein (TIGR01671 family)